MSSYMNEIHKERYSFKENMTLMSENVRESMSLMSENVKESIFFAVSSLIQKAERSAKEGEINSLFSSYKCFLIISGWFAAYLVLI
jgi:hypothetical protein